MDAWFGSRPPTETLLVHENGPTMGRFCYVPIFICCHGMGLRWQPQCWPFQGLHARLPQSRFISTWSTGLFIGICYIGFGRMRFGSNGFVVLLDFLVDSMKLNVNFRYDKNIYLMVFLNVKVRACQTKGISPRTITSMIFWLSVCTNFARNFTALFFPSAEKNPM